MPDFRDTYSAPFAPTPATDEWLVFRSAYAGLTVTLTLGPSGSHYYFEPEPLGGGTQILNFAKGIADLTVLGDGTIFEGGVVGSNFISFRYGIADNLDPVGGNQKQVFIQSALKGETELKLVTDAHISRLDIDMIVMLNGLDLQGTGQPPNPFYCNYYTIVDKDALSSPCTVTIDRPLERDYVDTWPLYKAGSSTDYDYTLGGPPTLYIVSPEWDAQAKYKNIQLKQSYTGGSTALRYVAFEDVTCDLEEFSPGLPKYHAPFPGGAQRVLFRRVDFSKQRIEVDKMIEHLIVEDAAINVLWHQSSHDLTRCTNSTITQIDGTPKKAVLIGDYPSVKMGPAYGRTDTIVVVGSAGLEMTGITEKGENDNGIQNGTDDTKKWLMIDGVLYAPEGYAPRGAVPGTWCFWCGPGNEQTAGSFQILDAYMTGTWLSGGRVAMPTTWVGGFPDPPPGETALWFRTHPCPCLASYTSIGVPDGKPGRPWQSFVQYEFVAADVGTAGVYAISVIGKPTAISFFVTEASPSALTFKISDFNQMFYVTGSTRDRVGYNAIIDMTVPGERIVAPGSGVTGGGGSDSGLSIPADAWFTKNTHSVFSANTAGAGKIVVTIYTDQGPTPKRAITCLSS